MNRAILFDMDGVLWHSEEAHATAFERVLKPLGIPMPDYNEIAGRRTDEVLAELLANGDVPPDPELVERLTREKRHLASEILAETLPVDKDCQAVLGALAKKFTLALATSASSANVRLFLDASGTEPLFDAVVEGKDVEGAKPAPDIYLAALELLNTNCDAAIVVEDSINGIRAARAAMVKTIGVASTAAKRRTIQDEDVLAVVDGLQGVYDFVTNLHP